MTSRPDLLVLGGGPAGATLGAFAAAAGARVMLIERRVFPRDKVCGEFVSAEGCRVLERLGLLRGLIASGARPMSSCRVTGLRGQSVDLGLPRLQAQRPEALGVSRARLDGLLLDLARRRGVEVRERWEGVRPLIDGGRVSGFRVRAVGASHRTEEIRAGVVAAADGRRSVLARTLHPQLCDPVRSGPGSWFGLKVHLDGEQAGLGDRVELHLFPGGYAGLAAVEDNRINLCLLVTVRALRACGGSPRRLLDERLRTNPALDEALGNAVACSRWKSVGPLRFAARRAAVPGAVFVGDAAGTIDPFSGEGISNALCGAALALPIVLRAIERGGLSDELAADWCRVWRHAFGPVTRRNRGIGRLLERPRLAGPLLRLLGGLASPLAPRLVAATRTARET